ncbi:MAG: hypothetical protein JXO44_10930 [Clostridia bacterium]|nr:hypothetical protein [Clostridia bacterium]
MTDFISTAKPTSKRNDVLKLIAIITMVIDHIGAAFFPDMMLFRTIGRIAFPIFAYQLAIGYKHTSNLSAYTKRLFIFGCISYVPYIYFLGDGLDPNPLAFNVIFLLLAGVGALILYDKASDYFKHFQKTHQGLYIFKGLLISLSLILYILLPELLTLTVPHFMFSYGTYGLLLMLSFHIFEERALPLLISFFFITIGTTYLKVLRYALQGVPHDMMPSMARTILQQHSGDLFYNMITYNNGLKTLQGYFFQARSIMAYAFIIPLGNKRFNFTLNKYVGYWFYPVHISLILVVSYLLYYR